MEKIIMKIAVCFISAATFVSSLWAATDGRVLGEMPKKCIGLYFDVMDTTPSNILANADQFAVNTPYLDGVAIGLRNIVIESADGSIVTTQFHRIMSPRERWTREALKDQIPYLKEIVKKPCLKESLLLFWMSPTKDHRIGWTDDEGWANFAENMAAVAWLAKVSGVKGFLLDPEEYSAQGGQAPQYVHTHLDPPYETCAKLARQRGREVFSAIYKEFPDAVILSLWFMSKYDFWLEQGRQMSPKANAEQSGELMFHFMNGILDVIPPEARIVDGFERYHGSALDGAYLADTVTASTTALPLVAPENIRKFRSQVYFSSGHYLEMYAQTQNSNWFWYFGPVNGSRLEHLRLNMEQAFRSATEYVWLYGERAGKLFNWRNGHYAKRKTWEEVIPGLTETMMLAKDPLGYAAVRKAELSKKGKLVNLVKEPKAFTLGNTTARREFHQPQAKMTSFKVTPGKRYGVIGSVEERGPKKNERLQGLAIPRVFFRRDGKPVGAAVPLQVHYDRPKVWQGATPAAVIVDVPAGADELVCDFGAILKLGERGGGEFGLGGIGDEVDRLIAFEERVKPPGVFVSDDFKRLDALRLEMLGNADYVLLEHLGRKDVGIDALKYVADAGGRLDLESVVDVTRAVTADVGLIGDTHGGERGGKFFLTVISVGHGL